MFLLLPVGIVFVVVPTSCCLCFSWGLSLSLFNPALGSGQRGAILARMTCFTPSMLTPRRSNDEKATTATLGNSTPTQWNSQGRANASKVANCLGVPHTVTRRPEPSNTGPFVQNSMVFLTHTTPVRQAL